ncbi:unnamed protein product [Brugia timori]|uniref:Uncharacterized protein n=1 Tax=Brugia timori TaxID=42155 RepID=A0A0R3Q8T5_9BILA|nr:unnamed protein product [Brugia timori]
MFKNKVNRFTIIQNKGKPLIANSEGSHFNFLSVDTGNCISQFRELFLNIAHLRIATINVFTNKIPFSQIFRLDKLLF